MTTYTTYNPADASPAIVLASGNLAVSESSSTGAGVRAATFYNTGKYYFETTANSLVSSNSGTGIASSAATLASMGSSVIDAAFFYGSGNLWINGSNIVNLGSFADGDVICFAVDLVNEKIWVRIGSGNWNGSGAANPSTNTGGESLSGFATSGTTNITPATALDSTSDSVLSNFGASAFTQAVPAGFTSGWPASLGGPTIGQLNSPMIGR
jgi:hypothetical protein